MKCQYYVVLIALFVIFAIAIAILKGHLEFSNWVYVFATLIASFAALVTAIIALGTADKPPRFVKFTVNTEVDKRHTKEHKPAELPNECKRGTGNNPFHSYRVYFKITNKSTFTLRRPVITFRLPLDLRHPRKVNNDWIPDYHSNFFNVQIDLRSLQYEDTILLSNSILPHLNDGQELPIWIRMCLLKDDEKPRSVYIDLNCDNAEGRTETIVIIPKQLCADISRNS